MNTDNIITLAFVFLVGFIAVNYGHNVIQQERIKILEQKVYKISSVIDNIEKDGTLYFAVSNKRIDNGK